MNIDFNNLDTGEDLSKGPSQSAVRDSDIAAYLKAGRILSKKHGMKVSTFVSREAANPVSQVEYSTRLYTLMHIIKNPELTELKNPLAETWQKNYTLPYNDKATNWGFGAKDRETIVTLLKERSMYKRFVCDSVKAILLRVSDYYKTNKIMLLQEEVRTLQLKLVDNGDILYRGVTIRRLAREYKAQIGDFVLTARHGTFDKMDEFLKQIDRNID